MATAMPGRPRILRVLEVLAQLYILLTVIGVLLVLAATLLSEASLSVELPVRLFRPHPLPGIEITDPPPAEIRNGGFLEGEFDVVGLSLGTRLWLAAGALAQATAGVLTAVAFLRVVRNPAAGTSFPVRLAGALKLAGVTLLVGGVVWQVLSGIGQAQAAREALFVSGYTMDTTVAGPDVERFPDNAGLPQPGVVSSVDFTPAWIGLALLGASSAVVYHGRRDEPASPEE